MDARGFRPRGGRQIGPSPGSSSALPQAALGTPRSYATASTLKRFGLSGSVLGQCLFRELGQQTLRFRVRLGPALLGCELLQHDCRHGILLGGRKFRYLAERLLWKLRHIANFTPACLKSSTVPT